MKKYFVCLLVILLNNVQIPAYAQYTGPVQAAQVNNAASASRAADKMAASLEGYLISKIRDEHYTFQDDSGTIEVEIDREYFPTVPVGPQTRVRLSGTIDKDFAHDAKVEVTQVEILAQ